MTHMSERTDIEHFRTLLLRAREELLALRDTRQAATATVELDQASVGRLSRMDALQQQAMAQDGRQRAELALRRIEAALRRCDDGSYGECLDCGEWIDPRRLELDPAATLCIRCAEARDG
jgi:DnaK suppressor protein